MRPRTKLHLNQLAVTSSLHQSQLQTTGTQEASYEVSCEAPLTRKIGLKSMCFHKLYQKCFQAQNNFSFVIRRASPKYFQENFDQASKPSPVNLKAWSLLLYDNKSPVHLVHFALDFVVVIFFKNASGDLILSLKKFGLISYS